MVSEKLRRRSLDGLADLCWVVRKKRNGRMRRMMMVDEERYVESSREYCELTVHGRGLQTSCGGNQRSAH